MPGGAPPGSDRDRRQPAAASAAAGLTWARSGHRCRPEPLPRRDLTVAALTGRLEALLQPGPRAAAAELGGRMAAEDGVAQAVEFINERIG